MTYDVATAWNNMKKNTFSKEDLAIFNHELFETKFEGVFKTNYRTAHDAANRSGRFSGMDRNEPDLYISDKNNPNKLILKEEYRGILLRN